MRASLALPALALFGIAALTLGACSGDDDPPPPPGPTCKVHADCPTGNACYKGECFPTGSCLERTNCHTIPLCKDERCFCDEESNRCLPACVTDNDCAEDGQCIDGVCQPYPVSFNGMPFPSGERGNLKVGLSRVFLDYPMGVELAGYGSRQGPRGPYTEAFGGSHSWFDRPDVRAAVFDDGKEMFVLLRLPLSWSTDFMLTRTALKVQDRTGINLLGKIVSSAPHSHAQPARYWHLVVGLGFGFFGYGEFSWEVFERITDSFADAVVMALDDLQPARFGYHVLESFDPDNHIHRDRRHGNDSLPGYTGKDDRMVILRVDDMNGAPRAAMVNFGMHGTVFDFDNPVITEDSGGGVEQALTRDASRKYDRPVLGFFLQGNAGDQSPAGDDQGHNNYEILQVIGARTWAIVEPVYDQIATSADVRVSQATQHLPITHEGLGYEPNTFFDSDVHCDGAPNYFRYGAFQCVEGRPADDDDPNTMFSDGDLNCVFAVECLTDGRPVPQFQKTVLAAARLGSLAFATMPGEPVSQFGRDIADRVKASIPGVTDAFVMGYSMDHHFYLLNEDDWRQGGYEPSRDIWGWRFGPWLADHGVAIAAELAKEPEERVLDDQNIKPMYWTPYASENTAWVPFTETAGDPAEILSDVPASVERLDEVSLIWAGGHPGIDLPHITLESGSGTSFSTVKLPGGWDYDDSGFEMVVKYEGSCTRVQCNDHKWHVRWQEQRDFPTGSYRLRVEGKAFKNGQSTAYTAYSRTFQIVPSRKLDVYGVELSATGVYARIADPPALALVVDGGAQRADDIGFLLRSESTPSGIGAPLPDASMVSFSGRVRLPSGGFEALSGNAPITTNMEMRQRLTGLDGTGLPLYSNDRMRPSSRIAIPNTVVGTGPAGSYYVELSVTDALGNQGTVTATVTR